jgi:hypothetical protein
MLHCVASRRVALCCIAACCTVLQALNLSANPFGADGIASLGRVLPHKPNLKHLIIDDQCLPLPPSGAPARPQVRLPELPPLWLQASLTRELLLSGSAALDVSSLAIGPQETAMLIAYLRVNPRISAITLSKCALPLDLLRGDTKVRFFVVAENCPFFEY